MSDLAEAFKKGWLEEDPGVVAAALLGIFTFVLLNILFSKYKKRRKLLKQQAIQNNTAIEARIISRYLDNDRKYYHGRYRYVVNGEAKEYSIFSEYEVPDTIMLYPKNSSMVRFFSDYDRINGAAIAFNVLAAIAVCVLTLIAAKYFTLLSYYR